MWRICRESLPTPFYRHRDQAILKLLLGAGLRLSELVGLNRNDFDRQEGTLKVYRKGQKEQGYTDAQRPSPVAFIPRLISTPC